MEELLKPARGVATIQTALDGCIQTLGKRNRDQTTSPEVLAAQVKFIEQGGAEYCLGLIKNNTEVERAWEVLWYASRPPKTAARVFAVPGLVQEAIRAMQGPAAMQVLYFLSNLAFIEQTSVRLATHPGLLDALVTALQGPFPESALILFGNLVAFEPNKRLMALTPGLLDAVDHYLATGGRDLGNRARPTSVQLQQQLGSLNESSQLQFAQFVSPDTVSPLYEEHNQRLNPSLTLSQRLKKMFS